MQGEAQGAPTGPAEGTPEAVARTVADEDVIAALEADEAAQRAALAGETAGPVPIHVGGPAAEDHGAPAVEPGVVDSGGFEAVVDDNVEGWSDNTPPPTSRGPGRVRRALNRVGGFLRRNRGEEAAEPEEGVPAEAGEEGLTPERGRFRDRLAEGLRGGFRRWVDNIDPRTVARHFRDRDWIWLAGFGVGVGETFLVAGWPPGVNGYARTAINLAVVSGGHLALNLARGAAEARTRGNLTGAELEARQEELANRYTRFHNILREFGSGLSSGVTITSLGITGFELSQHLADSMMPGSAQTGAEAAAAPVVGEAAGQAAGGGGPLDAVGQKLGEVKDYMIKPHEGPGAFQTPVAPGEGVLPPGAEVPAPEVPQSAAEAAFGHEAIVNGAGGTAETVGANLQASNDIVNEALRAQHINPASLTEAQYEQARLAVQHQMEALANQSYDQAASSGGDLSTTLTDGRQLFEHSLGDVGFREQAARAAEQALAAGGVQPHEAVSQVLENLPSGSVHEVAIPSGSTVGGILHDNGYSITWGPKDADMFGAHIAANYDMLTDMWGKMAQTQGWPEGMHYPVSLDDLPDLVERAKGGDMIALQKLKDALHWIPAGGKFNVISPGALAAAREVLAAA